MSPTELISRARSSQKAIRYTLTSGVSMAVSQVALTYFLLGPGWTPRMANIAAVTTGAVPSYLLNRYWAWGKRGRNHLVKEVLPFWGLALLGLALSTLSVDVAARTWDDSVLMVNAASLFAFGVLWVGKFMVFNELLFKQRPGALADAPALDGRTGIPT